jgi:hypothetical protein
VFDFIIIICCCRVAGFGEQKEKLVALLASIPRSRKKIRATRDPEQLTDRGGLSVGLCD